MQWKLTWKLGLCRGLWVYVGCLRSMEMFKGPLDHKDRICYVGHAGRSISLQVPRQQYYGSELGVVVNSHGKKVYGV